MVKKTLIIAAFIIAILYVLVAVLFFFFQKRFVFIPMRCSDPPPGGMGIQEVYFPTGDGQILHGWWMPKDTSEYTLIFFHGNGGCVPLMEERMRFFSELGYSTLAFDYRGYGKSSGSIQQEADIYEDGRSALVYLRDSLKIPVEKTIVWGWSLGGGVAVDVCRNLSIKALVLEGTFNSLGEIAQMRFPIFPTSWFLKYHFRSDEKISEISAPVFFVHSVDDRTIPHSQGKKMFDAFSGRKQFLDISGSHNHGCYENREKVIGALQQFLK